MAEDVEETAVAVDTEDGVAETPPERVDAAEPPIDDAAAPEGEEGDGTSDGKDDDDEDEGPPPLDAAEAVPMMTQGESQGTLACSVCLEPVAISGPHQVSALACGHCFGHSCIHTWLERKKRGNGGRCPQCNKKAVTKLDHRIQRPARTSTHRASQGTNGRSIGREAADRHTRSADPCIPKLD